MKITELQELSGKIRQELDKKHGKQFETPSDLMVDLMEEVGELAKSISRKEIRKEETEHDIGSEIIDIFLTLFWIANHYKIDVSGEIQKSFEKWKERFKIEI